MLIINADDFGQNHLATKRILSCYIKKRITSTSAMVFMDYSEEAAILAKEIDMDVGLHLNFTQNLTTAPFTLKEYQNHIAKFLTKNKYYFLFYNPLLKNKFEYVFKTQLEEFKRLYGRHPSHINGHHHMHLCTNILFQNLLPWGQKIRRNFTFGKGEKSIVNRIYRIVVDRWLSRKYTITDYFFSLPQCLNSGKLSYVLALAKHTNVELETHPEVKEEYEWLLSDAYLKIMSNVKKIYYEEFNYLK